MLQSTTWFTFEFLVYAFWLVATQGFEIINYKALVPEADVPELLNLTHVEHIMHTYKWNPVWLPARSWLQSPQRALITFPSVSMIYHMDRI
jgi:hypothetical protein